MVTYLKSLKIISLLIAGCTGLGFIFFLVFSGGLTVGGEIVFILTIATSIYFFFIFYFARELLKKEKPNPILLMLISFLFFLPFLFLLNIEDILNNSMQSMI